MVNKKKVKNLNKIQLLVNKKINLPKIKLNPAKVIEETKSKIGNLYKNIKKQREKEKIRLEKKKELDEKNQYIREKKQAQKKK